MNKKSKAKSQKKTNAKLSNKVKIKGNIKKKEISKTKKRSSNKNTIDNSNKFSLRPFHVFYLIVIIILGITFSVDPAKSSSDGGCSYESCDTCDGCASDCGCGKDDDDDGTDWEENEVPSYDEANKAAVAEQNAQKESCRETKNFQSSIQGDMFTYSYSIQLCEPGTVAVYIRKNNDQQIVIEQPAYLVKSRALSGSGQRPASEGFSRICVEINNVRECG